MNKKILSISLACLLLLIAVGVFAKTVNLSGTWLGKAQTPGGDDGLTIVLQKTKNVYSGTLSDAMAMASNVPLLNVAFKADQLTFDFNIVGPSGPQVVHASLKVSGDKMSGEWKDDSGASGAVELEKQKPEPKKN